jgi:SWI/SNF-related matrix-associated actin-dependent regulator of chromatin subfamily A protein 2/4
MIARSEDEFEKFQQMDIQRRREDAALGADRKPRLMEQNELPPFMLEEDDEVEEDIPEEILGRGNRNVGKKDTNYDDQMSEREWLKAIGVSHE